MIRVAVHGATGRMGRAIVRVLSEEEDLSLVAAWSPASDAAQGRDAGDLAGVGDLGVTVCPLEEVDADVVVDFTTPGGVSAIAGACASASVPLVSGTTGLDDASRHALDAAAEVVPIVFAPNMSVGVTLLFHLAELASSGLGNEFDAEIVEMHHRDKVDAPSGTAVRLAERVARGKGLAQSAIVHGRSGQVGPRPDAEIGVMTLRGGGVVGDHTLYLTSAGERLELTHRALDRSIFARGAVRAARWLATSTRSPGLYDMADVLGLAKV